MSQAGGKDIVMASHSPTCEASKIADGEVDDGGEDHSGTTLSKMKCLVQNQALVLFEEINDYLEEQLSQPALPSAALKSIYPEIGEITSKVSLVTRFRTLHRRVTDDHSPTGVGEFPAVAVKYRGALDDKQHRDLFTNHMTLDNALGRREDDPPNDCMEGIPDEDNIIPGSLTRTTSNLKMKATTNYDLNNEILFREFMEKCRIDIRGDTTKQGVGVGKVKFDDIILNHVKDLINPKNISPEFTVKPWYELEAAMEEMVTKGAQAIKVLTDCVVGAALAATQVCTFSCYYFVLFYLF